MSKKIVVGNWKMNPQTSEEAKKIFSDLKKVSKNFKTEMVICTPFVFLSKLETKKTNIRLGAQDVYLEDPKTGSRPFTGEVSASMLEDVGVSHVIVGHSERREMGESNETVNKKLKTSLSVGLTPIVCIGEKVRDEEGSFFEDLKNQIKETFSKLKKSDISKTIIAYEPVWAIGKSDKENMKGADLYQMVIFIRKILVEIFDKKTAFSVRIIYGGSVSSNNIVDLISNGNIDGILPGRASLNSKEMKEILEVIEKTK